MTMKMISRKIILKVTFEKIYYSKIKIMKHFTSKKMMLIYCWTEKENTQKNLLDWKNFVKKKVLPHD